MKKIWRYFLLAVMALCLALPCAAHAASVALLPLINNVEGDELASQVYYKQALSAIKAQSGFVLEENDRLTAAIDAAKITSGGVDQKVLAKIAEDGDVDVVFALQLDRLAAKPMNRTGERVVKLDMAGKAFAFNRLNGAYYTHELRGGREIDAALTARWDFRHEEFGRAVRQEISRALRAK